jgi:hypothetical protein
MSVKLGVLFFLACFLFALLLLFGTARSDELHNNPGNSTNYLRMAWTSNDEMNRNLWILDEIVCELAAMQQIVAPTTTTTTTLP